MSWLSENNPFGGDSGVSFSGDPSAFANIWGANSPFAQGGAAAAPVVNASAAPTVASAPITAAPTTPTNPNAARDLARQQALQAVMAKFGSNYGASRIGDTADDPFIDQIMNTQRGTADTFLNNMLKRGVVTETGAAGGARALDDQAGNIRSLLGDVGSAILGGGRNTLDTIANKAYSDASSLPDGAAFDINSYGGQADKAYNDFIAGIGDSFKSRLPTTPLFDTSPVPAAAGAAQGAQNLPFDPAALPADSSLLKDQNKDPYARKEKRGVSPF